MFRTFVTNSKTMATAANIVIPALGSALVNHKNGEFGVALTFKDVALIFDFSLGILIGQFAYCCAMRDDDLRMPGMVFAVVVMLCYLVLRSMGIHNAAMIYSFNILAVCTFSAFMLMEQAR